MNSCGLLWHPAGSKEAASPSFQTRSPPSAKVHAQVKLLNAALAKALERDDQEAWALAEDVRGSASSKGWPRDMKFLWSRVPTCLRPLEPVDSAVLL